MRRNSELRPQNSVARRRQVNFRERESGARKGLCCHLLFCLFVVVLLSLPVQAQEVVDKMVATVNGTELITYSDVIWQLALQPDAPLDPPSQTDFQRALERVIDQRLVALEAGKLPLIVPTDKEVDDDINRLIKRFPSSAEFYARLQRVGLNGEQIRDIVRRRAQIENYINFRFRSFTVVTEKDISDYYRDVFVPRFKRQRPGVIVPKFEEIKSNLEKELIETKVRSDITSFLEDARTRAEIITLENP